MKLNIITWRIFLTVVILTTLRSNIYSSVTCMNDSLIPIYGINKIVIENHAFLFIKHDKANGKSLFIINNNGIKQNYVPGVGFYEQFKNIPYAWDFTKNDLWSINGCHVLTESIYCQWVIGELLKIPLKDTSIWNNRKLFDYQVLSKSLSDYEINSLPITMVFTEKYGRNATEKLHRPFYTIKDSLIQNTYFNFTLTSNQEPIYFLLTEGELSIWKNVANKTRNDWQVYRKYDMSRFTKFHCFEKNEELYILTDEGILYKLGEKVLELVKQLPIKEFDDEILIINKDDNQMSLLNKNNLFSLESLEKIIQVKAINIF